LKRKNQWVANSHAELTIDEVRLTIEDRNPSSLRFRLRQDFGVTGRRDKEKGFLDRIDRVFCTAARPAAGRTPTSFLFAHSHPPAGPSEATKNDGKIIG
jgi:hypothetical protein